MRPDVVRGRSPGWEDPIVAEVRKTRQEIFARFNYDLDAYFEHLQAVEEEDRKRGIRYSDHPLAQPRRAQPDATSARLNDKVE